MRYDLERRFGRAPAGAWLAERVWEPSLPTSLVDAGYEYTVLDDNHLRGAFVAEDQMWGTYTTDDQGRRLTIFGTEKGLLVVRAPGDSAYQLQDGDVLMGIDGRVPEGPGHAFRILRSYQPGEKLKLDVLRNRKRVEVSITMPTGQPTHGAIQLSPGPVVRPLPPTPAVPVPPPTSDDGTV